jgi:phosphate butyryltransferase
MADGSVPEASPATAPQNTLVVNDDGFLENCTFDELRIGQTASLSHTVAQRDIDLFALATGDMNPAHVDPAYAKTDMFHHIIIHGMWGAGLISAVLGSKLPGPGTIYLGQDLHFRRPVGLGDTLTATVTVREKKPAKGDVTLDCICTLQTGKVAITGVAFVRAPTEKVRLRRAQLPYARLSRQIEGAALLAQAAGPPVVAAVIYPIDAASLAAALDATASGLITPLLIGPPAQIAAAARALGADIAKVRVIEAPNAAAAAAAGVALVRAGEAALLIKGDLHTETLMHPVVAAIGGLRTGRRISHVYVMDVPDYPRPLLITDAAINVRPTLADKADIIQNAIDLAQAIGIVRPRVAILAAVETVSDRLPSTIDAAALCKMAERGQITGGVLDGPLGLDNAINAAAAAEKGIASPVAGQADILIAPDLDAGNLLAKQLSFLAGAQAAGVVLGARVPIVLTSRADSARTRLASCALGVILARASPQTAGVST